jgi:4-hydroxybenzoate polyprenyltransferase
MVMAGGALDRRFIPAGLSLSLFYVGGMYLNDAFDRGIDTIERPDRPLPAGKVSAATVFAAGFAMLASGLAMLAWMGFGSPEDTSWRPAGSVSWPAPAAGAVLAAAIVLYDAYHKGNPWSPVLMGLCRVLVYVTAGLLIACPLPPRLLAGAAVTLCYLIGLTYVAKQETLRRVEKLWPLVFIAVPLLYLLPIAVAGTVGLLLYVLFVGAVLYALSFLVLPGHINVARSVLSLIAGISLLDALLIAGQGRADLAWIAVGAFLLTVVLQRFVPGT